MSTTLFVIGSLLFLHGAYQLTKYFIVMSEIRGQSFVSSGNPEHLHKILILAPVLHEEKTIERFLADLARQNYPKDCYEVYVVTTQKEYAEKTEPNTIDILERILSEKRFPELALGRIHYPGSSGFKADQLDFALKQIRREIGGAALDRSFFLLLDADADVNADTLAKFNASIEDGIEIYQQPLLWLRNVGALTSPLMQSFAFLQSFFSISYEIPMFAGRFFPWRLKYFVGHGLFIKGSFLTRIGRFPHIIEDVRMGRLSSFLGVRTKVVPGFGVVETAKSFPVYVKQSSIWFFGCGLFISDYRHARSLRRSREFNKEDFTLILYGFSKAFRWLNKGVLHIIGLAFSIGYGSVPMFTLFFVSLLLNSSIPVFFVLKDFRSIWRKKIGGSERILMPLRCLLFSPFLYMINCIGPYYGLIKLLKFYLWGKLTLPKTER